LAVLLLVLLLQQRQHARHLPLQRTIVQEP
jgi:hypothetical protein